MKFSIYIINKKCYFNMIKLYSTPPRKWNGQEWKGGSYFNFHHIPILTVSSENLNKKKWSKMEK